MSKIFSFIQKVENLDGDFILFVKSEEEYEARNVTFFNLNKNLKKELRCVDLPLFQRCSFYNERTQSKAAKSCM